jgi:hypothetical protein
LVSKAVKGGMSKQHLFNGEEPNFIVNIKTGRGSCFGCGTVDVEMGIY